MSFTNDAETLVLQFLLTTGSVTRPTAWYVGLFTAAPSDTGGGTEVSGGSYARQAVTLTVSGNLATNGSAIEWPTATADWGSITHVAVFDALTSGTMLLYGALATAKTISTGDVLRIPAGDLDITLD
jgi:hypothetical protein